MFAAASNSAAAGPARKVRHEGGQELCCEERLRSAPAALSASHGLASLALRFFAFSFSLDAGLFVERPQLHFLEDAFGCHLLLKDFYCSLQRTFNLNFHNISAALPAPEQLRVVRKGGSCQLPTASRSPGAVVSGALDRTRTCATGFGGRCSIHLSYEGAARSWPAYNVWGLTASRSLPLSVQLHGGEPVVTHGFKRPRRCSCG